MGGAFIKLIKMIIAPVIFCTIVLGVGSIAKAATVGNLVHPGNGLKPKPHKPSSGGGAAHGTLDFRMEIIPTSIPVLPTLFVALLVGFAVQSLGKRGTPVLEAVGHIQAVLFKILGYIMWVAPLGAFGAIAAVGGATGWSAVSAMLKLMFAFYLTCALFILIVLGTLLKVVTGLNILKLLKYLAKEHLLIFSTLLIGKGVGEFDRSKAEAVLDGRDKFDEATLNAH